MSTHVGAGTHTRVTCTRALTCRSGHAHTRTRMGTGTPTSVAHGGDIGPSTDTGVISHLTLNLGWASLEMAGIRRLSRALCHPGGVYSSDRKPKKAEVSLWSLRVHLKDARSGPTDAHPHCICVDPRQSSRAQGAVGSLIGWAGSEISDIARHGPAMRGLRLARRSRIKYGTSTPSVAPRGEGGQFVPINL